MLSFVHIGNNMNAAELSWYEEAILDACCRNIPASDELWHRVVEVSVLLLTCTQRMNPRSSWYDLSLIQCFMHLFLLHVFFIYFFSFLRAVIEGQALT